jgi:mannose-6-phosphate isomerase-like protein (cupin superfamily)
MNQAHIALTAAQARLAQAAPLPFAVLMQHGSMSVELFAPQNSDTQQPHQQDELYVIVSGTATLYRDGERIACQASDVLFVPAGMEHRFEDFTADFSTWVIFYGPNGGEPSNPPALPL